MMSKNKYLAFFFLFTVIFPVVQCQASKDYMNKVKKVKIAAAQVEIHTGNEVNIIVDYINQAGKDKAEMVVFGEYLLGAFYKTSDSVERVAKAAKENNIYVIVGGWDEFEPGAYNAKKKNAYANVALLFGRNGEIIGKYYKTHKAVGLWPHHWPATGNEHEWLMKAGDGYPVFDLDFGCIGIMTCYDGFFPESASSLSLQGAEIIIWINGRAGPIEEFLVKSDMFRNYCAMITTNFGSGSGTMIGTWPCTILAKVTDTGNHYITAELDMKELRVGRFNSRVFHQRRPKIYKTVTSQCKPWEVYQQLFLPEAPPGNIRSD